MKKQVLAYIVLIYAMIAGFAQANEMADGSKPQRQIDAIADMLARREIGRVEILNVPRRILTYASITPEGLEEIFHYKLTIHDMSGGLYRKELAEILKSTKVQPNSNMGDIRWGLIFYDASERRVGAIYLDGFGDRGAVDDVPVAFKGKLYKWLNRNFTKCFR